jgi:hypothetical protein
MTQEETQLLLKDICARLPYGVIIEITSWGGTVGASYDMRLDAGLLADLLHSEDDFKPYLRPMSSMTEEERKEYFLTWEEEPLERRVHIPSISTNDWLNEHHFDYRGLIPMGLALEAPADMYKTE